MPKSFEESLPARWLPTDVLGGVAAAGGDFSPGWT
jgi:hypothetical protein